MRIALGVEYNGSHYYGFQRQVFDGLPTIQEKLEQAISKVADHSVEIITAGRTDAGVHATGQVIHFDTSAVRTNYAWLQGINTYLPNDIAIQWVKEMPDEFHARFSAVSRTYRYLILNSRIRKALWNQRATLFYEGLDEKKMQIAANYFLGEHDFSSFRAAACQSKTTHRCIHYFNIERKNQWIIAEVKANAFLHHMVRNMMGVLMEIGTGKRPVDGIPELIAQKKRALAGITAPAHGLYLTHVEYPEKIELPANNPETFF